MGAPGIPFAELEAMARARPATFWQSCLSADLDGNRTDEVLSSPLAVVAREGALEYVRLLVEH